MGKQKLKVKIKPKTKLIEKIKMAIISPTSHDKNDDSPVLHHIKKLR
jgi:hypothetical protein